MLNRWIGIVLAAGMIFANATIIMRDVLPRWITDDPPPCDAQLLGADQKRFGQVGIYDDDGHGVGHSWTRSKGSIFGIVTVVTTTTLRPLHLPGGITTPRILIETHLTYRRDDNRVDDLSVRVYGLGVPITLDGEAMPTGEFACKWSVGSRRDTFLLDSHALTALGDVIRPFDRLPKLYVGQTWRLRLLDPLAQILPDSDKIPGFGLDDIVIRVTGTETITHQDQPIKVFVVEADDGGSVAYVDADGRVLRQEVSVPLFGQLVLLDEPYDADALTRAEMHFRVPDNASRASPAEGGVNDEP